MHYQFAKLCTRIKSCHGRVVLICDNETSVFYMNDVLSY